MPTQRPQQRDLGELSQWGLIRLRFRRHRLAVVSFWLLIGLYLMAALAEFLAPNAPNQRNLDYMHCPPQPIRLSLQHGLVADAMLPNVDPVTLRRTFTRDPQNPVRLGLFQQGPEVRFWGLLPITTRLIAPRPQNGSTPGFYPLGADRFGRCILSRAVYGSRVSLSVGLIGIAITFLIGVSLGGLSGYVGGKTDLLIQRIIEILQSMPQLPLWLALAAALPDEWSPLQTYFAITLLLSLLGWTGLARVVRGKILSLREEDYAVAARLMGASHGRVLFIHLLPGFTSHIIVVLTLAVPGMILGETSLSFLGLGLRPPVVSWGVMLQDCMDVQAIRYYPWLLSPVAFIVTTVLCFNFVGDGLRDAADPYGSRT